MAQLNEAYEVLGNAGECSVTLQVVIVFLACLVCKLIGLTHTTSRGAFRSQNFENDTITVTIPMIPQAAKVIPVSNMVEGSLEETLSVNSNKGEEVKRSISNILVGVVDSSSSSNRITLDFRRFLLGRGDFLEKWDDTERRKRGEKIKSGKEESDSGQKDKRCNPVSIAFAYFKIHSIIDLAALHS